MKKVISLVLIASMLLAIFTVIPVIASSEQKAPKILTEIDFDLEASGGYNKILAETSQNQSAGYKPFVELGDDPHKNVYAVYTIVGGQDSAHRGYLLRDSKSENNSALRLAEGKSYRITLDYKNVKTTNRWYNIGIIWVSNPDNFTMENLKTQFLQGKYNVFETNKESNSELPWEKASGIITPPDNKNVYPVLVVYNYGLTNARTEKVYMDNIVVSEYEFKTSNHIDFDYEAENGYDYYYEEYKPENQVPRSLTNLEDGVHDNVFSIGLTGNNITQRTYAIREEGTDAPLPLEYGKEYTIELSYKNKKSQADYNISIAWVENPSICPITGLPQNYSVWVGGGMKELHNASIPESYLPIKDCPYVQDVATNIAGGIGERGWVKIENTITPYSSKKIYPVLLVRSAEAGLIEWQAIFFDDITITLKESDEVTFIDFDAEAEGDYSTEYFIEEGQDRINAGMKPFKEVNGNNVYSVYTSCGGHDSATRGYALRDSRSPDNVALKLTYGKNYRIKLDYKNIKTIYRYHCIGLIWVNDPKSFTQSTLQAKFLDGKFTTLETFVESTNELEWRRISGVITPPDKNNLYPVLALYNYGYTAGGQVEVQFDNISITEYEFKTSNYTDFSFEVEENDYRYYYHETRTDRPATLQTLTDDAHKNVFHIGVTLTSGTHRAYAIREQGTADPLALKHGLSYDIKLNYKNVSTLSDYNISVAWVADPSIVKITGVPGDYYVWTNNGNKLQQNATIPPSYNPINTSANAGLYVQKISSDIKKSSTAGDWNEISATITPPDDKRIYPVVLVRPVNYSTNTNESVYIDDISIQLLDTTATDETEIDFDLEAKGKYTYYQGGDNNSEFPAFKDVDGNNVYTVYTTKHYGKNLQKGYLLRNSTSLLDAPLKLNFSQNYEISMDYRNIKANGTYYVAIDWVDDPADINANYKPENICTLAMVAPTDHNRDSWRKIKQIITPHDSENLYPVLLVYSRAAQENNLEICFDNISVKRTSDNEVQKKYDEEIKIDFDSGSQPEFYSDSNNDFTYRLYSEEGEYWTDTYENNGKSAVFDRYASSTSNDSSAVVVSSIRAIGLCNTEGTRFANLRSGDILEVSIDINVVKSVESDFFIGMAFASTTDDSVAAIGGYRQYGGLYNLTSSGMLCDIENVDATVSKWRTIKGQIIVPEHTELETAFITMYCKRNFGSMYGRGQEIYVDNIIVKKVGTAHSMEFDSNGGSEVKTVYFLDGDDAIIPPVSKREGYEFAGWYYDSELTQKYDYASKMPDKDLTLYAKWQAFPQGLTATTLKTGFEKSDYKGGKLPYTNISQNGEIKFDSVTDDINSENVTVHYDGEKSAKSGEGYLEFQNKLAHNGESSAKAHAVALLNTDGSNYYIVKGNRYRIRYAIRVLGQSSVNETVANPVINLVVSGLTPVMGLSMNNATVIDQFSYTSMKTAEDALTREGEWTYYDSYFEAAETGKAYMIMYDNTYLNYSVVMIDDLEIVPSSDTPIAKVTYKSHDGNKTYGSSLGVYGADIKAEYLADVRSGYVFDGWRCENGELFEFEKFPSGDITIKASYKKSEVTGGEAVIDWDKSITTDFENPKLAEIFYLDKKNVSNTQAVGLTFVTGDEDGAHSGSSYFKFRKIKGNYQFKVYAENSPDNYIWLDENSEYLVTYYVKVADMPQAYNVKFTAGTFNSADSAGGFTEAQTYEHFYSGERNEWIKVQQRITAKEGQKALGIKVSGGPVTAYIDDVTVKKLGIVSVKFNSNGGSAVEKIETAMLDYAIEPDYPTKDGYEFGGWYTDAELKHKFDFNKTAIEDDITLYAKWVIPTEEDTTENNTPSSDKKYQTVYETEYVDEIVENDLSEYGILDAPTFDKSDSPSKNNTQSDIDASGVNLWIIIAIAAAILVIAIALIIIIAKRKKKA